jgi:LPS export ABC transporter protein LptC
MKMYDLKIFIFLAMFFLNCRSDKPVTVQKESTAGEVPDQEMWESNVTSLNRGKKEAVVHYGHMIHYPDRKFYEFDTGIQVDFYDKTGAHASTLTAKNGEMDEKTNNVKATKNVVVVSDSGVTLFTEEIAFNQELNKIISTVDVKIATTQGDTFYGVGFESDPQLTDYEIKKLSGTAHKGLDLTMEKWKKEKSSVTDSTGRDSTAADSGKGQ